MNCPNCTAEMERHALEGKLGRDIEVDVCFACHVLWLDKRESLQLSPRGTMDLFRVLHEHRDDPRHALGDSEPCPRCARRLSLLHDIGKGGRFSYYSCPGGDGRLTPFSEFLKEKQFVRQLSPAEQIELRARVQQVQCSRCGAPVDLAKGFECGHCGSPLSVLDTDAVEKTLKELDRADRERSVDPVEAEARARAIAALEATRTDPNERWGESALRRRTSASGAAIDLLATSIEVLFSAL